MIVGIVVFAIGVCSVVLGAEMPKYAPNREITGAYDKSAAAVCENGIFVGERKNDVIAYRGIPYAQQPMGKLRWKAPLAPMPSKKVYEAFHFGKSCIQTIDHEEKASLYEQGEDCLTLCVYRNASDPETRKPVLVFIHGGGYNLGGTSDPTYDGINFVTQNPDAILVVITYRFGMMGYVNFLQMPDGKEYSDALNLGQLDQIAALKWVNRNIAAFGGDPDRVTIFGESAGGGSVSSLVLSPEARKYFRRAIPMSGVANYVQDRTDGQGLTEAMKTRFGAKNVADLVKVDADSLADFWREEGIRFCNFPTRDGVILPVDPIAAWTDPALKDIEVMQGVTRNEWRYFIAVFGYEVEFFRDFNRHFYDLLADGAPAEYRADAERLLKVLEKTYGKDWALAEFISGHVFRAGQMFQALAHARNGGKEFFYRIDKMNSGECHELRGADHGVELPYLFGNLGDEDAPDTEANRRYARMLQRMWVNFAKTGNPSLPGIEWPVFDDKTLKVMILGSEDAHVEANPEADRTILEQRLIVENPKFKCFTGFAPVLARMFKSEGTARFDAVMRKKAELGTEFQNKTKVVSPADMVVYGTIRTAETEYSVAEAFAVKDGKFVYVGDKAGVAAFIKEGVTRVVDHRGKGMVMPACTDGHAHYLMSFTLANMKSGVLFGLGDDKAEVLRKLDAATRAAKAAGKKSLIGFGWNYYTIIQDKPTLAELDAATHGVSIVIFDSSGHNAFGNSECLCRCGIIDGKGKVLISKIDGGILELDGKGYPTGFVDERVTGYLSRMGGIDANEIIDDNLAETAILQSQELLLSTGITTYMEGWSNCFHPSKFYEAAARLDKQGKLKIILPMTYEVEPWQKDIDKQIDYLVSINGKYRPRHVLPEYLKIFMDGCVETKTGAVSKPYKNGVVYKPFWSVDRLTDITRKCNAKGIIVHTHTMGDVAISNVTDAYIRGGDGKHRNCLVHVRHPRQEDFKRFADNNIACVAGMTWHVGTEESVKVFSSFFDEYYVMHPYPIKSFFDAGVKVTSHSDFPANEICPQDPFGIMEIAVSGRMPYPMTDKLTPPFYTEELITREQAFQALTINGAWQVGLENERGSIKVGKWADFVLTDKDVFECPVTDIRKTKVVSTWFEGEKVYPALPSNTTSADKKAK